MSFLATSKKTQVAAGEYCGLRGSREPDEVEAAISGISKLLVSQFINLQSGFQDKTIHLAVQTDHETMTNMKTEFMVLWDGFSTDPNVRVMVLAATNRPSELDEAILRRLPQAFEIGMPDRKDKAEILKVGLKGERVEPDIDYDHVARLCEGYTR
ncbi:hypothetical protein F2Q70_00022055 [Brassica cretica]|uniref:ATPase AAA-type core domain-containing protein n=1 Tax=Brassica cretica TaxID=69181 RepID=A0A8S9GLI6_BRACR|nr:hypothetical protein F2Q70_00022055 [Brassica cretica]